MRSELPRIHPGRKLTEEQWEELRVEVGTDADHTVKQLCARKGVSVARFYKKFPKGERPASKTAQSAGNAKNATPRVKKASGRGGTARA